MIFGDFPINLRITCRKYRIIFFLILEIFSINSKKFLRYFDDAILGILQENFEEI